MSFGTIIRKELADLIREKRFGGWAITFLVFWSFFVLMTLIEVNSGFEYRRDYPTNLLTLSMPMFFFLAISFIVLALFVLSDGITKERESGMLPVVGSKPIVRWHLVLAKLLAGLAIYAAAYVITLMPMSVLAVSLGTPVLAYVTSLYLGPFLALYTFMLGLGLLVGVAMSSSKVAIGSSAGIYLGLFLLLKDGPMTMVVMAYPKVGKVLSYSPFQATLDGAMTLAYGGVMPWVPLLGTALLGGAMAASAFWLFQRQEVAA